MEVEFLTADTALPPCLPLPGAMLGLPVSSTAKVMYAKLLGAVLTAGVEDANGILFVRFPLAELAVALGRSTQTCKRGLRELDCGCVRRSEYRTGFMCWRRRSRIEENSAGRYNGT